MQIGPIDINPMLRESAFASRTSPIKDESIQISLLALLYIHRDNGH